MIDIEKIDDCISSRKPECKFTVDEARDALDYNKETGVFMWKRKVSPHVLAGDIAGTPGAHGYIQIRYRRVTRSAQRWAVFLVTGEWPSGQVDHINRDRTDNRWDNLRVVDQMRNQWNTQAKMNNTLGLKGITFDARIDRYVAGIRARGRSVHLGAFVTQEEAIAARNAAVIILHGDFGVLTKS